VLYDNPANDPYSKLGLMYSIMLRNLLGHFNTTVDLVPIQNYTSGMVGNHDVTFYTAITTTTRFRPRSWRRDDRHEDGRLVQVQPRQLAWNTA
jgi:uncharacterized protein YdaL